MVVTLLEAESGAGGISGTGGVRYRPTVQYKPPPPGGVNDIVRFNRPRNDIVRFNRPRNDIVRFNRGSVSRGSRATGSRANSLPPQNEFIAQPGTGRLVPLPRTFVPSFPTFQPRDLEIDLGQFASTTGRFMEPPGYLSGQLAREMGMTDQADRDANPPPARSGEVLTEFQLPPDIEPRDVWQPRSLDDGMGGWASVAYTVTVSGTQQARYGSLRDTTFSAAHWGPIGGVGFDTRTIAGKTYQCNVLLFSRGPAGVSIRAPGYYPISTTCQFDNLRDTLVSLSGITRSGADTQPPPVFIGDPRPPLGYRNQTTAPARPTEIPDTAPAPPPPVIDPGEGENDIAPFRRPRPPSPPPTETPEPPPTERPESEPPQADPPERYDPVPPTIPARPPTRTPPTPEPPPSRRRSSPGGPGPGPAPSPQPPAPAPTSPTDPVRPMPPPPAPDPPPVETPAEVPAPTIQPDPPPAPVPPSPQPQPPIQPAQTPERPTAPTPPGQPSGPDRQQEQERQRQEQERQEIERQRQQESDRQRQERERQEQEQQQRQQSGLPSGVPTFQPGGEQQQQQQSGLPSGVPTFEPSGQQQQQTSGLPAPGFSDFPDPEPPPQPEPECECFPAVDPEKEEAIAVQWINIAVPTVTCSEGQDGVWRPQRQNISVQVISTRTGNERAKVRGIYEQMAKLAEAECEGRNRQIGGGFDLPNIIGGVGDSIFERISSEIRPPEPVGSPLPVEVTADLEDLLELVRQIHQRLGVEDYPVTVPEQLLEGRGGDTQVASLTQFLAWYVKQFDALVGQFPIDIEVEDIDPTTEGNQTKQISLPNISEALAEIFGMNLRTEMNAELSISFLMRLASEVMATKNSSLITQDYAKANASFLGYKGNPKKREIPYSFNPDNLDSLEGILEESKKNIIGWQDDDKETVVSYLQRLAFSAGIIKAVFFRGQGQLEQLLKEALDMIPEEDDTSAESWQAFIDAINNPDSNFNRGAIPQPRVYLGEVPGGANGATNSQEQPNQPDN